MRERLRVSLSCALALVGLCFSSLSLKADDKIRLAPGDYKTNYNNANYKTDSLSLSLRSGSAANLLEITKAKQRKANNWGGVRMENQQIAKNHYEWCKANGYDSSWYKNENLHAVNAERFVNSAKK